MMNMGSLHVSDVSSTKQKHKMLTVTIRTGNCRIQQDSVPAGLLMRQLIVLGVTYGNPM